MDAAKTIVLDAAKFHARVAEAMGDDVLPDSEMDAIMVLALQIVRDQNPGAIVGWGISGN